MFFNKFSLRETSNEEICFLLSATTISLYMCMFTSEKSTFFGSLIMQLVWFELKIVYTCVGQIGEYAFEHDHGEQYLMTTLDPLRSLPLINSEVKKTVNSYCV